MVRKLPRQLWFIAQAENHHRSGGQMCSCLHRHSRRPGEWIRGNLGVSLVATVLYSFNDLDKEQIIKLSRFSDMKLEESKQTYRMSENHIICWKRPVRWLLKEYMWSWDLGGKWSMAKWLRLALINPVIQKGLRLLVDVKFKMSQEAIQSIGQTDRPAG